MSEKEKYNGGNEPQSRSDFKCDELARLIQEATDEIEKLRAQYKNLLGQVVQARDGFGIYRDSPTMAAAIRAGEEYFFDPNIVHEPQAPQKIQ